MRTVVPLDQKGTSLVVVLVVMGIVGLSASVIMTIGSEKRKFTRQMNVRVSANLVKQKLVGMVLAPQSWQVTQNHNIDAFKSFNLDRPPRINIYAPDSSVFYKSTDESAGFDLKGNPCTGFGGQQTSTGSLRSVGNDSCPLRYVITLKDHRVDPNGNWIDKLHFELHFKPASSELVLNPKSPELTFELVRNLNDQSVEAACISISGRYDANSNSCSVKITKPAAVCGANQTYRGPATNESATNCDNKVLPTTVCAGTQVVKGFNADGSSICGAPI